MNSYDEEVTFFLPGAFTQHLKSLDFILEKYHNSKYVFKDNIKIGCVYGAPKCIWNGGHYSGLEHSKQDLQDWKDFSEKWNIPIRFTFTNCLLKEEHTGDPYGNMLLEMFNTGNNEIICVSPVLEKYIRNKYGDSYRYISSTSKSLTNIEDQINEINKDYFLIVLDIDNNKNMGLLSTIKNTNKIELLCNSTCQDNCPRKKAHYNFISRMQLDYGSFDKDPFEDCPHHKSYLYQRKSHNNFITPEDINSLYIPLGCKNFKLEGRFAFPPEWVETVVYYLIKDEYALQIRQELFKLVW